MVPVFCGQDNILVGNFWAMGKFNLLSGQSNLLVGQMSTQLTCYLPPCHKTKTNLLTLKFGFRYCGDSIKFSRNTPVSWTWKYIFLMLNNIVQVMISYWYWHDRQIYCLSISVQPNETNGSTSFCPELAEWLIVNTYPVSAHDAYTGLRFLYLA